MDMTQTKHVFLILPFLFWPKKFWGKIKFATGWQPIVKVYWTALVEIHWAVVAVGVMILGWAFAMTSGIVSVVAAENQAVLKNVN